MAGGVAQGVDPEFKPQYHQNKKVFKYCKSVNFGVVDQRAHKF
jgi:hypothetical protein